MSMNEIEQHLRQFILSLESFQSVLNQSTLDIEKTKIEISLLRQDTMREEYENSWTELHNQLLTYRDHIGPRHIEFMQEKLNFLSRYLHEE